MHTYYQTTLAITGTRSSGSRLEYATEWDFTANSAGNVTGVYERAKQTYSVIWEQHPQSSFSSYSLTMTEVHFGFPPAPPTYPGSGKTEIIRGSTSYTAAGDRKSNTYGSSSSITIAGVLTDNDYAYQSTTTVSLASNTASVAYTSASALTQVTGILTSSSQATVAGTTGVVATNGLGTTASTTRTFASFYTVTTSSILRTTRASPPTSAYTSNYTFEMGIGAVYPVHFDTILEAEPHERGYVMDGTEYSAGFPADVAHSFSKTTLAVTTFQSVIAPVPDTTSVFQVYGTRTTTRAFGLISTFSSSSQMTRYSADGWWPMTATQTEAITRISSFNVDVTLDTTSATLTTVSGNGYEQGTVYSTIHSFSTFAYSIHTNSANDDGAVVVGHRIFDTVVAINTETPITSPISTIGTSTYGTGSFNSYSTQVPNNGQSQLVFQTSSSTASQSALTSATSSTQFNPSWSELGTLQTSREDYFTSTSLMSSKSSTTTSAVDIFYTTIFGQSTEHYQTTRDIRSSHSTTSVSGFSYYSITNSSTDTCNVPPETVTASGGVSGALTTSETYSTLIHNAAVTGQQLYTSFSETTYTDSCSVPPGLSISSGRTSIAGSYVSETYKSITHNAVLIPSSSSTSTSVFYDVGYCTDVAGTVTTLSSTVNSSLTSHIYVTTIHAPSTIGSVSASFSATSTNLENCFEYPPGIETQSGETTNSTLVSQTFVTFSHDPLVTNSSASTFTSESTYTETCDVPPATYVNSGASTYYDFFQRSETRSSTFATTVHNASYINFNLSYNTTSSSFTENCGIYNRLDEQSTTSSSDDGLTAYTIVTYHATLHSAPNPHTVTHMTYGTFVTYQRTYGIHTITSLTSVITITNSVTAGNVHLLTRQTLRTSTTESYTAPGAHSITYSTEVTFSTVGTTYGTHTVTEQTYYSSTIPSSVGFGTHTLSWETRITTTYSSSGETTSLFTSPFLSFVSSSASYSETTITSSETSSVSVNSTLLGTPTVTLGSTVFTEIQGLTWTRISQMARFGDWRRSNVLSESDYLNLPYVFSTRESMDGGISPIGSWGAPRANLVPGNGLTLYFPAFARGRRREGYSDFYRLSLSPGSSTFSSGASRSTVSYGSGEVLSLSSCRTTAGVVSVTNTFQGVVSFSLTGTSGYYAPAPGPSFLVSQTGTGHFGGLPAAGDVPGTVVLPPGVWHFTSQKDGTATSEVSTWLTDLFSFTTTAFGLKMAAGETEVLRYCTNSYEELFGVAHPATFSIPLYHKGFSTDSTYHS